MTIGDLFARLRCVGPKIHNRQSPTIQKSEIQIHRLIDMPALSSTLYLSSGNERLCTGVH
jgi:hypothetical protein